MISAGDKNIQLWKPICFDPNWCLSSTTKLSNILPSWERKREQLKKDELEYEKFLNQLKRQQAIETGIVERLYDLKTGITETFIKEGFVESYLQHGDTNIDSHKLMAYLNDHIDAIDFVFDFVKNDRIITRGFILELHHMITMHQEYTNAIDQLGNPLKIDLLRGKFKVMDNNPRRTDGLVVQYCPPVQVDSEVDSLIGILQNEMKDSNPIIKAAWLHHAFTQIHPFQDGNGRMARLLASFILIKENLFPFIVTRHDRKSYIESLEAADSGQYQPLIDFFCDVQVRNIEYALNWKTDYEKSQYTDVVDHFAKSLKELKQKAVEDRMARIFDNMKTIFNFCHITLENIITDLNARLGELIDIQFDEGPPSSDRYYWFNFQIIEFARTYNYFFNRSLDRCWFGLSFSPPNERIYRLIISIHHYGYDDSTIAIGGILEITKDDNNMPDHHLRTSIPIEIKPLTLSIESAINKELESYIQSYLQDIVTVGMAHISNDLY